MDNPPSLVLSTETTSPPVPPPRPKRATRRPEKYKDYVCSSIEDPEYIPMTFEQADGILHSDTAIKSELAALEDNNTWDLVTLPPGKKAIGSKWVFRVKHNPDGSINKHKARLVAKGFLQRYGRDFLESFAPVAKTVSVRILIALAASHHWNLFQLDINNAFLHGTLDEEI